jgi:two-component system, cell cycle sensor histidine kinase and response regulator CckA
MNAIAQFASSTGERKQDPNSEFSSRFQNAPLAIAWCDVQGRVTAWNPAMERILGSSALSSEPQLSDLVCGQNGTVGAAVVSEFLRGERDSLQVDGLEAGQTGESLRWSAWRYVDRDNSRGIFLAADYGPSKRNSSRQAERLEVMGRLTGGVVHDFNNLLTGVLLHCDLLLATLGPTERARRYAEEIRNAGFQASGLVQQLLSLGKPTGTAEGLSLNDLAEGMRNFLAPLVGENIELILRLDCSLGMVNMDPAQAQQILLNLVLNSRDALSGGGQITVETCDCKLQLLGGPNFSGKPPLRCALFMVTDNGTGMDRETREHVFEPFFTTKAGRGTGLGLTTVRDIVTYLGGLIHVESRSGKGTRVSVLLPVLSESLAAVSADADFHPAKCGELALFEEEE